MFCMKNKLQDHPMGSTVNWGVTMVLGETGQPSISEMPNAEALTGSSPNKCLIEAGSSTWKKALDRSS